MGPKLKVVLPAESQEQFNLKHHGDEIGLYTEQERDFDHIANLKYYKEQVTSSLIHVVCLQV